MSFKSVVKENAKVSAGGILWKYLVIQTPLIETTNFHCHLTWQNDPWRIHLEMWRWRGLDADPADNPKF